MSGARNEDSGKVDLRPLVAEMNAAAVKRPPARKQTPPSPPVEPPPQPPPRRRRRWLVLATAVAFVAVALAVELATASRPTAPSAPDAASKL